MTQRNEIYKCEVCGNTVEVLHEGSGELVCCGKPMILLEAKETDEGYEKHVPTIEKKENGYLVKVGSIPHPMIEEHYIEWIELLTDGEIVLRRCLKPGDKPEAFFETNSTGVWARELCNIHGLWKSK